MYLKAVNVIDGAEAFHIKGNHIGILLIHGFVGTPQSVQYIGEQFGRCGYTVIAPRLKGHGTRYKDLNNANYQSWIDDCEQAYKALKKVCSQIIIIGQSMGGTLALLLASKFKDVSGVITINAAFEVPSYEKFREAKDNSFIKEGLPDINDQTAYEITYEHVPVHAIKQLLELIDYTKQKLDLIKCPLLLFKSKIDHVVPPASTDYIYDHVESRQKIISLLENSYHVASMDFDKEQIVNYSNRFIKEIVEQTNHNKLRSLLYLA